MKKDLIGSGKKVSVIIIERLSKKLRKLDVVNVSRGYFRNYLKPNKFAVVYTEETYNQLKASVVKTSTQEHDNYRKEIHSLNGQILYFAREASAKGILFGSVTNKDISCEIKNKFNVDVDYRKIELMGSEKKIGKLGVYEAALDLFDDLTISLKINVGLTLEDAKKLNESSEKVVDKTESQNEKKIKEKKDENVGEEVDTK